MCTCLSINCPKKKSNGDTLYSTQFVFLDRQVYKHFTPRSDAAECDI